MEGIPFKSENDPIENIEYMRIGKKTTICLVTLKSGFEIVGKSACVDVKAFDKKIGEESALEDAYFELDKFQGYSMTMKLLAERRKKSGRLINELCPE